LDLLKVNCFSKKTRWSFLAVMAFNTYAPFIGQVYSDNYTTSIFDKLVYDGFGFTYTFYSGFACVAGGLFAVIFVEKIGRKNIIIAGFLGEIIMMWILAIAFYFEIIPLAIAANLCFCFILYFSSVGVAFVWPNECAQPFVCG